MNLIILISLMQAVVLSYDIVVIGSGLAGVSSTLEASLNNPKLSILILEKEKFPGGNSMKATSGINLLGTPL